VRRTDREPTEPPNDVGRTNGNARNGVGNGNAVAARFSRWVMRHPVGIVFFWILLAVLVRGTSPDWESLALDGDFDYLPKDRLSIRGERMLDVAFPANRPRSQVVILIARPGDAFDAADELASLDLLRRLHHRLAEVTLFGGLSQPETIESRAKDARESLNQAIEIDEDYFALLGKVPGRETIPVDRLRLKLAYLDRSNLLQSLGLSTEAGPDMQAALTLDPDIATSSPRIADRDLGAWTSLLDLVSWPRRRKRSSTPSGSPS
jgi:RND superfamily putative drug exporter